MAYRIEALEKIAYTLDQLANNADMGVSMATDFLVPHEGYRANAYLDRYAKNPVWTVGHGHTRMRDPGTGAMRSVRQGDRMDVAESKALMKDIVRGDAAKLYRMHPWARRLDPYSLAALYEMSYNGGVGMFSKRRSPSLNRRMAEPGADANEVFWDEQPTYARAGSNKGLLKKRREDARNQFRPWSKVWNIDQSQNSMRNRELVAGAV